MDTHISKRITAPRRVTALLCALCLLATTVVSIGFSTGAAAAPGDITVVYDDAIAEPFQNWSWADVDLESTTEVRSGSVAAAVDFDAWEGLYLSVPDGLDLPLFSAIEFSVHGGSAAPAPLTVQILDTNQSPGPAFTIDPQPGGWVDHSFSLADAGGITRIGGLWFQDSSGTTRSTVHIDDVRFVELPEPPPAGGPALTVDTGARTTHGADPRHQPVTRPGVHHRSAAGRMGRPFVLARRCRWHHTNRRTVVPGLQRCDAFDYPHRRRSVRRASGAAASRWPSADS